MCKDNFSDYDGGSGGVGGGGAGAGGGVGEEEEEKESICVAEGTLTSLRVPTQFIVSTITENGYDFVVSGDPNAGCHYHCLLGVLGTTSHYQHLEAAQA